MPFRLPLLAHLRQLLAVVLLAGGVAAYASAPAPHHVINWNAYVAVSPEGGHVLGNPEAKVKLVEYMSYTCPHCAAFETEGVAPLRLAYVMSGKVSLEIRHFLRDPLDATVAQLTSCVAPNRFMVAHEAFLHSQDEWIGIAQNATQTQTQRWYQGSRTERERAIAGDLGFYQKMESFGVDHGDVDRCLADDARAARIAAQTKAAMAKGVDATPSFELNGVVLAGTYSWQALQPQIDLHL